MARIRTVKPDFWTDEKIVELDAWPALFFIGLWNFSDDKGRTWYKPRKLMMQILPMRVGKLDPIKLLTELWKSGLIEFRESADSKPFICVKGWRHQRIENPSKGVIPIEGSKVLDRVPQEVQEITVAKGEGPDDDIGTEPPVEAPATPGPKPPRPKSNQQLIIEAFAANRGIDLSNSAIQDRFFKANGRAASELDKLTDGNLAIALGAMKDIAIYLDLKVKEHQDTGGKSGIEEWRHLEAINNNFLLWKQAYDKKRGRQQGEEEANG